MCQLCKGTHIVYEGNNFCFKVSCCPTCGPESDEIWRSKLESLISSVKRDEKEEETN
jgi:hypothetical protein